MCNLLNVNMGYKSKIFYFVLIVAFVEGQRYPALPLSRDSFQPIQRALMPAPNGRKAVLNDTKINYYRDSTGNHTSYRLRNVLALLKDATFDPQKRTVLFIHGYVEKSSDDSVVTVVKAYVQHGGFNILVLDWANLAYGHYVNVLLNIAPVGNEAGKAMLKLLKRGLNTKGLHIVGHSMGAHLGAVIARYLKARGFTVPRLTGLDAAYPGFYPTLRTVPINEKDADFVDIIHTDGGWFGAATNIGHADFWPNDGTAKQPGCLPFTLPLTVENFCNHWRSWKYWAESVRAGNFIARRCDSYDDFLRGQCSGTGYMGLRATSELRGNYYLRTATREPFALGERGAV